MAKKKTIFSLRNILIAVVVLIVLLVIARSAGWIGGSKGTIAQLTTVSRADIVETIRASGKIQPQTKVGISAGVSGQIIELRVKEGQQVKKGDLLAVINPDEAKRGVERSDAAVNSARAQLANAKAGLAQAQASLNRSKLLFNRNKELYAQKVISLADYENFEAEYSISTAQAEAARQTVQAAEYALRSSIATSKEARDQLLKTTLIAPMDGIVARLSVEVGEQVVGTLQMAGTELMMIADLSQMQVEVEVNENDIVRVSKGDSAYVEVDAYRGKKFIGLVTEIASSAKDEALSLDKVTSFVVKVNLLPESYRAVADSTGLDFPLKPGMTATVEILTNSARNALALPVLAVTTRMLPTGNGKDSARMPVVFKAVDGKAEMIKVSTGIQDNEFIQILSGLEQGESVVSGPYKLVSQDLSAGQRLNIKTGAKN